jgi:hypothetical protein
MNSDPHNPSASDPGTGEETLRLIASLPAPEGLEDRVHAALRVVATHQGPRQRILVDGVEDNDFRRPINRAGGGNRSRVLAWPSGLNPQSSWMRTAAAAAIVFVVAGGGWGVYSRVQQIQPARVIVMPSRMPASGGFSSTGAIRTPQILPGPTAPQPVKPHPAPPKAAKKPAASSSPAVKRQHSTAGAAAAQPAASR